jgi:hypothetical protein
LGISGIGIFIIAKNESKIKDVLLASKILWMQEA